MGKLLLNISQLESFFHMEGKMTHSKVTFKSYSQLDFMVISKYLFMRIPECLSNKFLQDGLHIQSKS